MHFFGDFRPKPFILGHFLGRWFLRLLSPSLSLPVFFPSTSVSFPRFSSLSQSLDVIFFLPRTLFLCLFNFSCLSVSVSVCLSFSFTHSLSLALALALSLSLSLALALSRSLSLSVSVSLSLFLSLSLARSLSFSLARSLSEIRGERRTKEGKRRRRRRRRRREGGKDEEEGMRERRERGGGNEREEIWASKIIGLHWNVLVWREKDWHSKKRRGRADVDWRMAHVPMPKATCKLRDRQTFARKTGQA